MRAAAWIVGAFLIFVLWPVPWWWKKNSWYDFFLAGWLFKWAKEEVNSKPKDDLV